MGRGKGDQPQKQQGSARLVCETWSMVDRVGGGNRTKGLETVCEYYANHCNITNESEQMVVDRIRKHIHAPESAVLREKYFMLIDEWFKDRSKVWNAPMIYTLFGATKKNGANAKKLLKQLVNTGFVKYTINGFRPVVRGNGGWTPEKFEIQITQYIEMLESKV